MKRAMVIVGLLVVMGQTGCAWLFQERLHGGLAGYHGDSEPRCSTSEGWALVDGAFAGLNIIGVAEAASDDTIANRDAIIVGGVLWSVIHLASALTGATWASSCRDAYKQWNDGGISPSEEHERRRLAAELAGKLENDPQNAPAFWCSLDDGRCTMTESTCKGVCRKLDEVWCARYRETENVGYLCGSTEAGCQAWAKSRLRKTIEMGLCKPFHAAPPVAPAPSAHRAAPPPTPAPRGFFCATSASSPAAGFCTREKADCQRARDAATAAVTDLDECKLVETAFCHVAGGTERCTPTMETCVERAKSALDTTAACEERK